MAEVILLPIRDESPEDIVDAFAEMEMQLSRRYRYLERRLREMCAGAGDEERVVLSGRVHQVEAEALRPLRQLTVIRRKVAVRQAEAA